MREEENALIENKLIHLGLLGALLCFSLTAAAQDDPEKDTSASEKDVPSAEPSEDTSEETPDTEAEKPPTADDGSSEEGEDAEAVEAEDSLDALERELDEELGEETGEDAGEDAETTSPTTLRSPKTPDLDMKALGQLEAMDPEKDLADNGPVDEKDALEEEELTVRKMDILELHGYFRVRPELFHRFNVRADDAVYNRTIAQHYRYQNYKNGTLAGANMRFRLDPSLNISENIRVKSQIDFLDNVMLGSTPRYWQGYNISDPATVEIGRVQGWDMGPPSASQMVVVRRAWAEVLTPLGQLRFGRMGDHWGTGMLHNSGNGIYDDFGDTVDRITFAAKINNWLIAPAFDFPSEGMSTVSASGRPLDISQLDDAYRLVGVFGYIHDEEDEKDILKLGDWLINTGLYFSYRWQVLSFENSTQSDGDYDDSLNAATADDEDTTEATDYYEFYKRELWTITPDLWFQLLYGTFHLELEAALIVGKLGNPSRTETDELSDLSLLQWGGVLQIDYGMLDDALRIGLEFGYANGDKEVESLRAPANFDQRDDNSRFTAFSFNPAYNTDLILHRHVLGSVSQSFYLKARLKYDFLKNDKGHSKLSLQGNVLYSRAIFDESVIGSSANLGVELNAQIRYLSDDGFMASLGYGVLFPLGAFKGDPDGPEGDRYVNSNDLTVPQTIQTMLGIVF